MTDDIDEIVQAIREKAWATSDADLAHGAADALERLKAERDKAREIVAKVNNSVIGSYGYFTEPSCVDAIEKLKMYSNQFKARAEAAEKERDGRKLECDELIKVCRDAEARAEAAKKERNELHKNMMLKELRLFREIKAALDRASAAEAEVARLNEALLERRNILGEP